MVALNDPDKTKCVEGHEFSEENTRFKDRKNKHGVVTGRMRICITCARRRSAEHRTRTTIIKIARELGILRE